MIDRLDLDPAALQARISELEMRLEESEDTLEAIRRGDVDAVVVQTGDDERYVYTLESADRPYRVLIEQIQEGAFTVAEDGRLLYCNRRLAELLKEPQEKLIGHALNAFVSGDNVGLLATLLAEARYGAARGELSIGIGDAPPRPMMLSLSQLDAGATTPIICGVLTDMSEQKLRLRELSNINAQLKTESEQRQRAEEALRQSQKMDAIGQLTGGVAHDFNNLLTIIKSSTELLRRSDLAEARRARYVDAISDTVDRAAKLTGQLLAFARRQSLKPEVFDVGERLRMVSDMLVTIVGSRILIERDVPLVPCFVEADASQFDTALINLAVNARDAMDGEGSFMLRVFTDVLIPGATLDADARASVSVSLTDSGCGIPKDQIERVFEPFFTTKGVGKGTGLGLSQVFGFAKQSGGHVDVASVVGRGTTFTMHLPRVAGAAALASPAAAAMILDAGGGRRILVVEDNVDVGTFSTQLLQDLGYETIWAASADEALKLLSAGAERFQAVFSDVVMPGHERCRIRARGPPPLLAPTCRADERLQRRSRCRPPPRLRAASKALLDQRPLCDPQQNRRIVPTPLAPKANGPVKAALRVLDDARTGLLRQRERWRFRVPSSTEAARGYAWRDGPASA